VKIERDLQRVVPRADWARFPHLLIWHGRRVCDARKPLCEECILADLCPAARVVLGSGAGADPALDDEPGAARVLREERVARR
jgi:endonuclease-3